MKSTKNNEEKERLLHDKNLDDVAGGTASWIDINHDTLKPKDYLDVQKYSKSQKGKLEDMLAISGMVGQLSDVAVNLVKTIAQYNIMDAQAAADTEKAEKDRQKLVDSIASKVVEKLKTKPS